MQLLGTMRENAALFKAMWVVEDQFQFQHSGDLMTC
jgi:hypothetical protein